MFLFTYPKAAAVNHSTCLGMPWMVDLLRTVQLRVLSVYLLDTE